MRCKMCGSHATWEHTVFLDMSPTKVRLCEPCQQKIHADDTLEQIKAAADHDAKNAAVGAFLKQVGFNK